MADQSINQSDRTTPPKMILFTAAFALVFFFCYFFGVNLSHWRWSLRGELQWAGLFLPFLKAFLGHIGLVGVVFPPSFLSSQTIISPLFLSLFFSRNHPGTQLFFAGANDTKTGRGTGDRRRNPGVFWVLSGCLFYTYTCNLC